MIHNFDETLFIGSFVVIGVWNLSFFLTFLSLLSFIIGRYFDLNVLLQFVKLLIGLLNLLVQFHDSLTLVIGKFLILRHRVSLLRLVVVDLADGVKNIFHDILAETEASNNAQKPVQTELFDLLARA